MIPWLLACAAPPLPVPDVPRPPPPPIPVEQTLSPGVYLVGEGGQVEVLTPLVDVRTSTFEGQVFRAPVLWPFRVPELRNGALVVVGRPDRVPVALVPHGPLSLPEGPLMPWFALGVSLDGAPVPEVGPVEEKGEARVWSSLPPGRWAVLGPEDARAWLIDVGGPVAF